MKHIFTAALALVLLASGAQAASWTVDHSKSTLGYKVIWAGEPSVATFKKWDAKIDFDPNNLAASKVTATIQTGSAVSDSPEYDDARADTNGFNASKFPQATFVTKSFRKTGANTYEATADLTIKGITKQVVLPFTLTITGNTAHMKGEAVFSRTDYKVGTGESFGINFDSDDPVSHKVTVPVDITATKVGG
jgi:polyisoprenoid-binding protein YceI